MGDGTSGHYAAQLKEVRKDTFTFLQTLTCFDLQWLRDIMYGNADHEWGIVIDEQ
jgi:hypothetical protein